MDLVGASCLYSVFIFVFMPFFHAVFMTFLRELRGVIGIRSNMKTVR